MTEYLAINSAFSKLILDNAAPKAGASSVNIDIGDNTHVDVLIRVGAETGSATITFYLDVIEVSSGATIRTYDSTTITTANTSDHITVDRLTLGTRLKVRYAGTLDNDNYFSGVYCRVVGKR